MPDVLPSMLFSGMYHPAANTTTATMVVRTSPLRRLGVTSRVGEHPPLTECRGTRPIGSTKLSFGPVESIQLSGHPCSWQAARRGLERRLERIRRRWWWHLCRW